MTTPKPAPALCRIIEGGVYAAPEEQTAAVQAREAKEMRLLAASLAVGNVGEFRRILKATGSVRVRRFASELRRAS